MKIKIIDVLPIVNPPEVGSVKRLQKPRRMQKYQPTFRPRKKQKTPTASR